MPRGRRAPQRSSGRALIAGSIGMILFAVISIVMIPYDVEPSTWRGHLRPVVEIVAIPLGIAGIVAGIVRIRRGGR